MQSASSDANTDANTDADLTVRLRVGLQKELEKKRQREAAAAEAAAEAALSNTDADATANTDATASLDNTGAGTADNADALTWTADSSDARMVSVEYASSNAPTACGSGSFPPEYQNWQQIGPQFYLFLPELHVWHR